MSRREFEVKVPVSKASKVWDRLVEELPARAELREATVVITEAKAVVALRYQGHNQDGSPQRRMSGHQVSIASHLGDPEKFLKDAFGKTWGERFSALL